MQAEYSGSSQRRRSAAKIAAGAALVLIAGRSGYKEVFGEAEDSSGHGISQIMDNGTLGSLHKSFVGDVIIESRSNRPEKSRAYSLSAGDIAPLYTATLSVETLYTAIPKNKIKDIANLVGFELAIDSYVQFVKINREALQEAGGDFVVLRVANPSRRLRGFDPSKSTIQVRYVLSDSTKTAREKHIMDVEYKEGSDKKKIRGYVSDRDALLVVRTLDGEEIYIPKTDVEKIISPLPDGVATISTAGSVAAATTRGRGSIDESGKPVLATYSADDLPDEYKIDLRETTKSIEDYKTERNKIDAEFAKTAEDALKRIKENATATRNRISQYVRNQLNGRKQRRQETLEAFKKETPRELDRYIKLLNEDAIAATASLDHILGEQDREFEKASANLKKALGDMKNQTRTGLRTYGSDVLKTLGDTAAVASQEPTPKGK